MSIKKYKILTLACFFAFLLMSGFECKLQTAATKNAMKPIYLEYWGVFDDNSSLASVIKNYQTVHPNIDIRYKKFRYSEYKDKILDALAEDRGPDIFSIHNTWVDEYRSKLAAMPPSVKIPFVEMKGSIKKEKIITVKDVPSISLVKFKNDFVDVVYEDCVRDSKESKGKKEVFCLPKSLDTLALFYNKDLLNAAGIPSPPKTWQEFQEAVKSITRYNDKGDIIQSAVGFGTSNNVERFSDILTLLMMQNGAQMAIDRQITFNKAANKDYNPGIEAFQFYTAFASPTKEVYTWNKKMPSSLETFIQGKTAFFFGYSYNIPSIKAMSPKLNFGIAVVPQIAYGESANQINAASYWTEAVSKKSKNANIAWHFIQHMSINPKVVSEYLTKTKKPTALRSLISSQLDDENIYPFVSQTLTVKSWYKGIDSGAMENIFAEMVDSVEFAVDLKEYQAALNLAARKIGQTY